MLALSSLVVVLFAAIGVGKSSGSQSIATEQTADPEAGIELIALRTEHSRTYLKPDGTKTAVLSGAPMNFRDATGLWRPIDSTLVTSPLPGYSWTTAENSFRLDFKNRAEEGFVRLELGHRAYFLSLEGASSAPAVTEGAQASYRGVLPNVDVVYTALPDGVKEALLLANASAPLQYRFWLDAPADPALRAEAQPDGSWLFFDGDSGTPVFLLQPPFAIETGTQRDPSSTGVAGHRGRTRMPVSFDVSRVGEAFALDVEIDPAWLQAPGRSFPVVIDPTITVQPALDNEANWDFGCPAAPNCYADNSVEFSVGTEGAEIWRAGMKFDLGELPSGTSIGSATLRTYFRTSCLDRSDESDTCNVDHTINVHRMTSSFTSSTPTSQVSFDPAVLSAFTMTAVAAQNEQWLSWNVTSAVQSWSSGQQPNHGFLLKRATEPADAGGLELVGRWWQVPELRPRLEITFGDGVDLAVPTTIASTGATLKWSQYAGAGFQRYEVHRSNSPRFTPSASTLLATITNSATTTYTDTTASPSAYYTYEVGVNGTKPSNERTVLTPAQGQTRTIIQPAPAAGKSTYIFPRGGANGCLNYGGYEYMRTGTSDYSYFRVLLGFNLTGIPSTATIVNAKVALHHPWYLGSATTIRAHRITSDWAEGNDVDPSACAVVGASWINRLSNTVNWTTPGGDFDPTTLATVSHAQSDAPSWDEWEIGSTVQKWVAGQSPNYGVLLKEANETVASGKWSVWYHSDDFLPEPSLRPKLVVTWATDSSGGGLTLFAPGTVNSSGAVLSWSRYTGSVAFQKYEVHRSLTPNFTPTASTRLATITNIATTTYTDTTGAAEETYAYKIVANSTQSNEQIVELPAAGSTTKILQPDPTAGTATSIYSNVDDSASTCRNAGGDPRLLVGSDGHSVFRTLLSFDLSSVPAGATVTTADLSLRAISSPSVESSILVQRVTRAWQEGSDRLGALRCATGGATWQVAAPGTSWTTPGGDADPDLWSSVFLGGPIDRDPHQLELGLTGLVDGWRNGQYPNYGLLIRVEDEAIAGTRTELFSDDATEDILRRPRLEITYSASAPTENDLQMGFYEDGVEQGATPTAAEDPNAVEVVASAPTGEDPPEPDSTSGAAVITNPVKYRASLANKSVTFINDDGEWTIYLDCIGPGPGRNVTVGPGYIAKFVDARPGGSRVTMVNGQRTMGLPGPNNSRERRHIADAGGLGVFGWHHARGVTGTLAADDKTHNGIFYRSRSAKQFLAIEGQRCAEAIYTDPPNPPIDPDQQTGYGVSRQILLTSGCIGFDDPQGRPPNFTNPSQCRFLNSHNVGALDIEVWFKDRWQDPVMKVTYRWRIRSEGVKVWIGVQPTATAISNWDDPYTAPVEQLVGTPFVKEPKLVAGFLGGSGFTRMFVFSQDRAGKLANVKTIGHMRGGDATTNVIRTTTSGAPLRTRVRWEYITDTVSNAPGPPELRRRPHTCPAKTAPPTTRACFSVVMRAYDGAKVIGPPTNITAATQRWRSGTASGRGKGLDQWAIDQSATSSAFPVDTTSGNNPSCTPTDPRTVRNWEFAGRKNLTNLPGYPLSIPAAYYLNNPNPFVVSGAMFHAWTGGRGYTDCEPLLRAFVTNKKYGVFASFGLNDTYPKYLKAQINDSP